MWTSERARHAALKRHRAPDDPELLQARADFEEARAQDERQALVDKLVQAAPAFTEEQRTKLRALIGTS